jgi:hypothetical protein
VWQAVLIGKALGHERARFCGLLTDCVEFPDGRRVPPPLGFFLAVGRDYHKASWGRGSVQGDRFLMRIMNRSPAECVAFGSVAETAFIYASGSDISATSMTACTGGFP